MALRSYDYENENYFDELWIAEGVTSYYDDLLQRRAGLLTRKDYLRRLGRTLERVMEAPGVRVQSLRASSYDTWIKHYRPDENSVNARISYYTKGALVAWLLDAKIRTATKNEKSLDDVMRLLYQRHLDDGYSLAKFRAAVDEVAGEPLSEFLARAVDQTEMLDFQPAANFWGLQLGSDTPSPTAEAAGPATAEADAAARDSTDEPTTNQPESAGDAPRDEPAPTAAAATAAAPEAPFIGASVRDRGGRLVIARVLRDSPADRAGWNVDDELVGIEQFRASESLWNNRLRYFPVGEPLKTLLSRRGQLIERTLVPAPAAEARWRLRFLDKPTDPQQTRRDAWLGVTITSAPGTDAVATEP
jgi:predicted metalloprotease with PDZ domain